MKGCDKRGRPTLRALALLVCMAGSASVAAKEADAHGQRDADALQRFAEVMLAKGRNEQCKVLDQARSEQYERDTDTILTALEKRIPAQQLLGVALNTAIATGAPASAAGCDEASRQLVEAGSEQARAWAEELRGRRSRGKSTQGK